MQNQKPNIEQAYQTIAITWFALFVSQLLFLVLIYFVKPQVFKFDFSRHFLGENPVLVIAFALVGISTFVMSLVMKKKYLDQSIAEQNIGLVQTAMIIGCALCEAISLYGLLLAFLESYQYFFLWFALAILGFILHFPHRDNLIAASYRK